MAGACAEVSMATELSPGDGHDCSPLVSTGFLVAGQLFRPPHL
jgi:hypothetical protein